MSEPEPTFQKLLKRAKSGDEEALGILLDKHRKFLLMIANQELPANIAAKVGASDVVQESMITAHQQFERFDGETKSQLRAWLRQFLIHDLHHARRAFQGTEKRQINRERAIQLDSSFAHPLVDPQLTPQTNASLNERVAQLKTEIGGLPKDYRDVVELHSFQELSFDEIGQIMNRSPDAARKLWTRAMMKLGKSAKN